MSTDRESITLETYELVLLRRTRRAREFDEETIERIFHEHLAYTMGMVGRGQQLFRLGLTRSVPVANRRTTPTPIRRENRVLTPK